MVDWVEDKARAKRLGVDRAFRRDGHLLSVFWCLHGFTTGWHGEWELHRAAPIFSERGKARLSVSASTHGSDAPFDWADALIDGRPLPDEFRERTTLRGPLVEEQAWYKKQFEMLG